MSLDHGESGVNARAPVRNEKVQLSGLVKYSAIRCVLHMAKRRKNVDTEPETSVVNTET